MKCESANKKIFLLTILLIFIDQSAKYIIRSSGGFYICNKGIAFGINLPNWLIIGLIIAILAFASFLILNLKFKIFNELEIIKFNNFKLNSNFKFKILNYPLVLILSGAISNLLDRLYNGCVIDFIDLRVWPVFNLADIFICLGAFLLILKFNKK
ncbi:MAG: signal peptidase II [Parcubacteria group bacterium]|jgi:signal peptidase II